MGVFHLEMNGVLQRLWSHLCYFFPLMLFHFLSTSPYTAETLFPPFLSVLVFHFAFSFCSTSLVAILEIPCVEYVTQPLIIPFFFLVYYNFVTLDSFILYPQPRSRRSSNVIHHVRREAQRYASWVTAPPLEPWIGSLHLHLVFPCVPD